MAALKAAEPEIMRGRQQGRDPQKYGKPQGFAPGPPRRRPPGVIAASRERFDSAQYFGLQVFSLDRREFFFVCRRNVADSSRNRLNILKLPASLFRMSEHRRIPARSNVFSG